MAKHHTPPTHGPATYKHRTPPTPESVPSKPRQPRVTRPALTQDEWILFVRVWQDAASIGIVTSKLGITASEANSRARLARKKGVALKKFGRGDVNWSELAVMSGESVAPAAQ